MRRSRRRAIDARWPSRPSGRPSSAVIQPHADAGADTCRAHRRAWSRTSSAASRPRYSSSRGSPRRRGRRCIRKWSRQFLRMLKVEARVHRRHDGEHAGQRADRRQPCLVARHLRAELAAAGTVHRQGGLEALADRRPAHRERGYAVHRARAAPRHACGQPPHGRSADAGRCGGGVPRGHDERRHGPAQVPQLAAAIGRRREGSRAADRDPLPHGG